jgi:diguanylate cyclase (GGDEF)-like protein
VTTIARSSRRSATGPRRAAAELIADNSHEMTIAVDDEMRLVSISQNGFEQHRLFDLDVTEMLGQSLLDLVHPSDRSACADGLVDLEAGFETGGTELRVGLPGGPYRYVFARARLCIDERGGRCLVALVRDIHAFKLIERQLAHAATYDALTTLPNRALFWDRLVQVTDQRSRTPTGVAVLVLNLDGFKYINDGLGSLTGDEVLIAVAARLRSATRAEDTLARLGSDEFGILGEGYADEAELIAYATRLRDAVRAPLTIQEGTKLTVDSSIGIAFSPASDRGPRLLLREADAAKNLVKTLGRGGIELTTGGLNDVAEDHLRLELELREALVSGQLCVHYQPQIDRRTGQPVGVEALVRWVHPQRGMVSPGEFIALAEESDLIVDIGAYVLEEAAGQTAAWRRDGLAVNLSVNLAARQLLSPAFCDQLESILLSSGLEPDALTLEVTESTLFLDTAPIVAVIDRVRRLGVHLSLDDFGTGYCSFVYLRRFDVEVIKIDQSFVRGIGRNAEDEMIIRGIVNLARSLEIDLVAEGVETEAQAEWLAEVDCHLIQGYLYCHPLPAAELRPWLWTHMQAGR